MKISVIIPTYNEKDVLQKCIDSLLKQTYKDLEVIVVDDGSTDPTSQMLRGASGTFKLLNQTHSGAGSARNLGAKNANGQILVFVDADMTFDVNFIKNLINPILEGKIKGTFSKDEMVSNWENVWSRCWNLNEGWEDKRRHPKKYPDHQPVFRAILKSEFDKVGGFTSGGYDDDWSLSKKLGYEATLAPNAIFYHKNPDNLKEIFLHAKWVAKRKYKMGYFGYFIALIRSSLPISIISGILITIRSQLISFIVFKIVYDFGIFVGILEYMLTGKESK